MHDEKTPANSTTGRTAIDFGSGGNGAAHGDAANSPAPEYFDFQRHQGVQEMRKEGIWTDLGPRFGNMEVRLRPFYEGPVVVKKEAVEADIRMRLGLSDDEPLPGEYSIECNKAAVTMAITGARAKIKGTTKLLEIARKHGFQVDGDLVSLLGEEEPEAVRELYSVMMAESMHMVTTLVRASRGLHRLKDEEVARVGKGFIYGRHVKVDWAD